MVNGSHFVSVIVPIYKQENTIRQDLLSIYRTLEQIRYPFEIIAVVDGKKTDNSYSIIKSLKLPHLKAYTYKYNHGKGYAIRYGMAKTKGDYIAFIDAGMEIDPNGISLMIEHLEWYEADIIAASKNHPASIVNYPWERRILSFGAHIMARYLLGINITDTQAGLKIFRRKVLEKVLPRLIIKTYAFDLEILAVANRLGFKRIFEAPIRLNYCFTSLTHANNIKVIKQCFLDALAIFYRLKILKYYDDRNRQKWIYDKDLQMRINTGETLSVH